MVCEKVENFCVGFLGDSACALWREVRVCEEEVFVVCEVYFNVLLFYVLVCGRDLENLKFDVSVYIREEASALVLLSICAYGGVICHFWVLCFVCQFGFLDAYDVGFVVCCKLL